MVEAEHETTTSVNPFQPVTKQALDQAMRDPGVLHEVAAQAVLDTLLRQNTNRPRTPCLDLIARERRRRELMDALRGQR